MPRVRQVEGAAIVADRIVVGWEGRINREREINVRVGGVPVGALASQDPVAGHIDSVRIVADCGLIPGLLNVHEGCRISAVIDEGPGAVEAHNAAIIGQMGPRRQESSRAGSIGR